MSTASKGHHQPAPAAPTTKHADAKAKHHQGASKSMHKSMNEMELEEFSGTRHKGRPEDTKH